MAPGRRTPPRNRGTTPVDTPEKMEALIRDAGFASVRAWTEEISWVIDADHLLRLRTSMGALRARFDSLDAAGRTACVAEARRRMKVLAPEDFMARGKVVYAVGCM